MNAPTLLRGDARAIPLVDESVDLVVASPPYFGLRDYGTPGQIGAERTPREYLDALVECTREMVRVLKPGGSIFVNLGDRYAARRRGPDGSSSKLTTQEQHRVTLPAPTFDVPHKSLLLLPERFRIRCVDELGLIARAVLVWAKPNGLPESVTDRVRRSHEDWVHLTREPRYYACIDSLRTPHTMRAQRRYSGRPDDRTPRLNSHPPRTYQAAIRDTPAVDGNPAGRLPPSVWEIPTQPLDVPDTVVHASCCAGNPDPSCVDGVDHHAAFPMEWPRRLIRGWCPPGGTVLDPFGGTGTTALVATMLGCRGISVELSADYQHIARWRTTDPRQRAHAAGHDTSRVAPTVPGQTSLFEDVSA